MAHHEIIVIAVFAIGALAYAINRGRSQCDRVGMATSMMFGAAVPLAVYDIYQNIGQAITG